MIGFELCDERAVPVLGIPRSGETK